MKLEKRLKSAANELNKSASNSSPPPLRPASQTMRPWLAFAVAFAVVLAVFGIPYVLGNLGGSAPSDAGPLAGADSTTTTTTTAVETTIPGATCAAGEWGPPTTVANGDPSYDLTEPVAEKLTAMAAAAGTCDAAALSALASDDITTTFGPDGGPENIASWAGDDERFEIINELFNMSHGVTEMPDGLALYVWPAAFAYDTWEEIPHAQVQELLRIYSQEELNQFAQLGSYGGWRIGITEAGEWIFFVAGD